jgi:hypothetical protein
MDKNTEVVRAAEPEEVDGGVGHAEEVFVDGATTTIVQLAASGLQRSAEHRW